MVTYEQVFERREKVRQLYIAGERSARRISKTVNCDWKTAEFDLRIVQWENKKRAKLDPKTEERKYEREAGLLQTRQLAYVEFQRTVDAKAKVGFLKIMLDAEQKLAELWGLISSGKSFRVDVNAHASASATAIEEKDAVKDLPSSELRKAAALHEELFGEGVAHSQIRALPTAC